MREKLEKLLNNSYAPYSKFRVSCVVVMKDGNEVCGVNVENASYGACICAERNAITTCIANGYKRYDFKEIHVMVDSDKIGSPCFMCRQVISELFEDDCKVYMYSHDDMVVKTVRELCPMPFGSDNL